jgi:hypothetical protein
MAGAAGRGKSGRLSIGIQPSIGAGFFRELFRAYSERQGPLDEAAEKQLISETIEIIAAAEGKPPKGWLGPWVWNF